MMTLSQLKSLLLSIDPNLKKDFWNSSGENYTLWTPHHYTAELSDDRTEDAIVQVTIDRFTTDDKDDVIYQIRDSLEENNVTQEDIIRTIEEETGYIRFILECFVTP